MPKWIKYSYCYDVDSILSRNNWTKNDETMKRIQKEAKGIIFYAKNGYIDDKEFKCSIHTIFYMIYFYYQILYLKQKSENWLLFFRTCKYNICLGFMHKPNSKKYLFKEVYIFEK